MAAFLKKSEKNADFAKGGDTPMFGAQGADEQDAGQTAVNDDAGPGDKFAKGGSNKMFGYSGAQPARAGITGAR